MAQTDVHNQFDALVEREMVVVEVTNGQQIRLHNTTGWVEGPGHRE